MNNTNRQGCLLKALIIKPLMPVSPLFSCKPPHDPFRPGHRIASLRLSYRAKLNTAPMARTNSPNPYSWPILIAALFVVVLAGAPAVPVVLPVAVDAGAELVVDGAVLAMLALADPQM